MMEMTPGDKAILMKAKRHASGRSANALDSQSAWSSSVCHPGDTPVQHREFALLLVILYQRSQAQQSS